MSLNQKQKKHLKRLGHSLSPVVIVADRGLVDTVMEAIEEALGIHELIKVKIRLQREQRAAIYDEICEKTASFKVQVVGMVILIYRPSNKSIIKLPGPKPTL